MIKVRSSGLDIFEFLKSSDQPLPVELSTASLEVLSVSLLYEHDLILSSSLI